MRGAGLAALTLLLLALSVAAKPIPGPLISVDGPQLLAKVRDGQAKLTVVNVWATWCDPCLEEFPHFVAVDRAYKSKGVRVLFVSTDFGEDVAAAVEFLKKVGAPLPSYLKEGKDEAFIEALSPKWVGTLPATVVFDRAGRRLRFFQGKVDRATLEKTLDELLAADQPQGESKR